MPRSALAGSGDPPVVSLGGDHQRLNGALAVELCAAFERDRLAAGKASQGAQQRVELLDRGWLPQQYARGLASTAWLGRSTVRNLLAWHALLGFALGFSGSVS